MSQINVNTIKNKSGAVAPNFPAGAVVTGVVTATTFKGAFDGGGNQITGINASNISSGTIDTARVPTLNQNTTGTSGGLSGTPDITVQNITGVGATFSGNVSVGGTLTYEDVKNVDSIGIITARTSIKLDADGSASSNFLSIGADDDLKIFHESNVDKVQSSGSGLHIRQINNGDLHIHAGADNASSNNRLVARAGGKAELYYGGNLKLSTETSGVNITGICTASGTIIDDKGNVRRIPQNNQSSAYTIVAADAGKHINISTGGVTFAANEFIAGDAVTIINNSSSNQTITCGAVTMYLAGDTSTKNSLTLAGRGMASFICMGGNVFYGSGGGLS